MEGGGHDPSLGGATWDPTLTPLGEKAVSMGASSTPPHSKVSVLPHEGHLLDTAVAANDSPPCAREEGCEASQSPSLACVCFMSLTALEPVHPGEAPFEDTESSRTRFPLWQETVHFTHFKSGLRALMILKGHK